MQRVLDLYGRPAADGRVICLEEFGAVEPDAPHGQALRPAGSPARLRATYNRYNGVMQMISALDLATGRLYYRACACRSDYSPHKHP
ncbi:hypothetical protein [Microbispora sp. H10885]|uniref:hypothetical protein n=1 Tax=Microbispora sp. H10885 TaxID=2729110 RepID=UPI0015FF0AA0|nr:hypothetical protein [Microbispora sp. H10885]